MAMSKEQLQASSTALLTRAEEAGLTLPGKSAVEHRVNVGQLLLQCRNADGSYDVEKAWEMMQSKFKPKVAEPLAKKEKGVKKKEEEVGKEDEQEQPAKKKAKKAAPAETKKEKKVAQKKKRSKEGEEDDEDEEEESDEEDEEGGRKKKKGKGKPKSKRAAAPKPKPAAKKAVKSEGGNEEAGDEEEDEDKKKNKKEKIVLHCDENEELAKCFLELGRGYYKQKDSMRGAAYMKAYKALMECDEPITSGKQAQNLNGVGKSSANKVQEFLEWGKIATLEEMKAEAEAVM